MYARVTRWEGGDAEAIRHAAQEMTARAPSGPPAGVPSTGITLLIDPDGGRAMAIGLFETEEDLREGDRVLNEMTPPGDMGRRAAVETYQVPLDVRHVAAAH